MNDELIEEYEERFDDNFPTIAFMGCSPSEMDEIIKDCLEKDKNVYECGYLDLNNKY